MQPCLVSKEISFVEILKLFMNFAKKFSVAAQPGDHRGQGEGVGGLQRCHERCQGRHQLVRLTYSSSDLSI